jgi:hypothetical protein
VATHQAEEGKETLAVFSEQAAQNRRNYNRYSKAEIRLNQAHENNCRYIKLKKTLKYRA